MEFLTLQIAFILFSLSVLPVVCFAMTIWHERLIELIIFYSVSVLFINLFLRILSYTRLSFNWVDIPGFWFKNYVYFCLSYMSSWQLACEVFIWGSYTHCGLILSDFFPLLFPFAVCCNHMDSQIIMWTVKERGNFLM